MIGLELTKGLARAIVSSRPEDSAEAMHEAKKDFSILRPHHLREDMTAVFKNCCS